jgi:DNA-binding IclR family transcriptional regulator
MATETLKTIERTLQVLSAFSRARPELTVAELVELLGFPRAVVTRIVATLEQAQFLQRETGGFKYRIGIAACELGATYLAGNTLTETAREILSEVAAATGNVVYLGARRDDDAVILGLYEGSAQIRFIWSIGDRLPLATTALGKSMLLHMSSEEIDAILGRGEIKGLAPRSITHRQALDEQLGRYREKGWMPVFEESLPGVFGVGAAILDAHQKPIAGISISFLLQEDAPDQIERMGRAALEAAKAITRRVALN